MAIDNKKGAADPVSFLAALVSGGVAGTSVDVALFPLDTIKTRVQSSQGFMKAGGFQGIYKGVSAAAAGSAPGAALFFTAYEQSKAAFSRYNRAQAGTSTIPETGIHMVSASIAEVCACLVRVPTEVVKQRMQTGMYSSFSVAIRDIYFQGSAGGIAAAATTAASNITGGSKSALRGMGSFYVGFNITIMREIPFSLIQFPLYEFMKSTMHANAGRPARSYEAAIFGSISGGIAAALTTPLDVIKTRLMLRKDAQGVEYKGAMDTIHRLYQEASSYNNSSKSRSNNTNSSGNSSTGETTAAGAARITSGAASGGSSCSGGSGGSNIGRNRFNVRGIYRVFFAGIEPRVMWISIGGFVFFGAYEQTLRLVKPYI